MIPATSGNPVTERRYKFLATLAPCSAVECAVALDLLARLQGRRGDGWAKGGPELVRHLRRRARRHRLTVGQLELIRRLADRSGHRRAVACG